MMKIRLLFSVFSMLLFSTLSAQVESVGLIGTATPGGWDADTNMVQDVDSAHLWTMDITLVAGEAKFRANDAWDINWGSADFPLGIGVQEGANMSVPAGDYHITFNSNTGEYYFEVESDIGIIGSASLFGWDRDVNMFPDDTDSNLYTMTLNLVSGAVKFRQNDDWAVNWGGTDFPSGIGTQGGPDIPIALGGEYVVTFNKSTGAYNFTLISFSTVGIIGDATPGGWLTVTPLTQTDFNPKQWTAVVELTDGGLQFSGDNGVAVWGGSDFPSGTATIGGDTVPVTGGTYIVNFNTQTGAYSFEGITVYSTIGIIGDATPGLWDFDTDMARVDSDDSSQWELRIVLTDGFLKFRADNDWAVNWGSGDFPSGTGTLGGADIPVTAGEYSIQFNSFTGVYLFTEIIVPDRVGLVGAGTPLMSWDIDFFLTQDPLDENVWTYASIDLNGEVKFRADSMWDVNWGATDFPEGIGVQLGPNIPVPAGTYGITFNSNTGHYVFGPPLTSTKDVLNPDNIHIFPNPASVTLNIDLSATNMRGEVNLNVFDMHGKLVMSDVQTINPQMKLNIVSLQDGYYTLQISNDKYIIGKKFVVLK